MKEYPSVNNLENLSSIQKRIVLFVGSHGDQGLSSSDLSQEQTEIAKELVSSQILILRNSRYFFWRFFK